MEPNPNAIFDEDMNKSITERRRLLNIYRLRPREGRNFRVHRASSFASVAGGTKQLRLLVGFPKWREKALSEHSRRISRNSHEFSVIMCYAFRFSAIK